MYYTIMTITRQNRPIAMFLLACVLVVAAVFRLTGLGAIPPGLTNDEADVAYDAYSLAKTGKDQWGTRFPVAGFRGFGDWRPPLYTYAAVPFVAVFGPEPWAVRLPSAIVGVLSVAAIYVLASLLFSSPVVALAAALLLAVSPWHIAMSRVAIESNLALFLVLSGSAALVYGMRKPAWLPAAAVAFSLSLYAYTASLVFAPLFVIGFVLWHRKHMIAMPKRWLIGAVITGILIATPLFAARAPSTGGTRLSQVGIMHDTGIIDVVNERQGACRGFIAGPVCQLADNRYATFALKFLGNYLEHYSPRLLFLKGTDTQFSVMHPRGLMHLSDVPFMIVGLFVLAGMGGMPAVFVALWLLAAPVADSMTSDGHYSRFLVVLPGLILLGAAGLGWIVADRKRILFAAPVALLAAYELFVFGVDYRAYFPMFYSRYSHYQYRELAAKLDAERKSYDSIIVSSRVNDEKQYVFYLVYTRYPPERYQGSADVEHDIEAGGWVRIKRIGNLHFLPSLPSGDWIKEHMGEKILLVGAPDELPNKKAPAVFEVRDLRGDVLFKAIDAAGTFPSKDGTLTVSVTPQASVGGQQR